MKLIVDLGNSCAKMAVFEGDEMVERVVGPNDDLSLLGDLCSKYHPTEGIISTVVAINERMQSQIDALDVKITMLDASVALPITIGYETPKNLGPDRLAAVAGAVAQKPGHNLLVIDAGTCITYEFVDSTGCYRGGNISPGLKMRLRALEAFTCKLPLIDAEGDAPDWGISTETAIRSGVLRGMKHEIEGYINSTRTKYPDLLVFLTGGDKFSFDEKIKSIIFADRFLVLKGLNRILDYNNGRI
jgi:type III pantothenate kinase